MWFSISFINSFRERPLSAIPQESLFVSLIAICYCHPADRAAAREGSMAYLYLPPQYLVSVYEW